MPFYVRKSVRVGPFRFNLSKSGIGISAGVKGFRVGSGPRGNYVHMGCGGLYYRAALSQERREKAGLARYAEVPDTPVAVIEQDTLQEIASADASIVVDSSSAELVGEMSQKRQMVRLWPRTLVAAFTGAYFLHTLQLPDVVAFIYLIIATVLVTAAAYTDRLRKTTVVLYDLEADAENLYKQLHEAFEAMAECAAAWHIAAEGAVNDRKRNAGASSVVKRSRTAPHFKHPPYVKTNVAVMAVPAGRTTLYFFPDKVLLFQKAGVGAVSYSELRVSVETTRFIEDGSVPQDAKIVDRTWQYVNKKGGPDKRFSNNRELPIVLYEDVVFSSATGLNERIQISRLGCGEKLKAALGKLSAVAG